MIDNSVISTAHSVFLHLNIHGPTWNKPCERAAAAVHPAGSLARGAEPLPPPPPATHGPPPAGVTRQSADSRGAEASLKRSSVKEGGGGRTTAQESTSRGDTTLLSVRAIFWCTKGPTSGGVWIHHAPNNGESRRGQFNWDEPYRLIQRWVAKTRSHRSVKRSCCAPLLLRYRPTGKAMET